MMKTTPFFVKRWFSKNLANFGMSLAWDSTCIGVLPRLLPGLAKVGVAVGHVAEGDEVEGVGSRLGGRPEAKSECYKEGRGTQHGIFPLDLAGA